MPTDNVTHFEVINELHDVHVHVHMYTCTCTCNSIIMKVHICVHVQVTMYKLNDVHVHIYVYMYTCTRTCNSIIMEVHICVHVQVTMYRDKPTIY